MSLQGLRSSIGAATGCAYAGPWLAACDGLDALPRSVDVIFVVGLALFCVAVDGIAQWLQRREEERTSRRWLETYAREQGLEPMPRESTTALRRRLAAHLSRLSAWRSR